MSNETQHEARVVLPEIRPGIFVVHRLNRARFIVIELEGDGAGRFFTARAWDMTTWRLTRDEVDVEKELPGEKTPGQYL